MDVRDAVEADAERLAELTGSPRDVMRNLVHDRTVRVVERDGGRTSDEATERDGVSDDVDSAAVCGFVSYDARADTVHVTQLEGDPSVSDRLLEEPVRFAEREGMAVELLVPEGEAETREAAERAGFDRAGRGPTFEGESTVKYRLDAP
ncbi:MAG: hypothetical protein V5A44_03535 [Haloarculaceae archaeon]